MAQLKLPTSVRPRPRNSRATPTQATYRQAFTPRAAIPRAVAAKPFEQVESRQMFSVSLNAAGWTTVTPSSTAEKIYVSSSKGNDANTGLSAANPVKTLAQAYAKVRANSDDQVLLNRGDTWTTTFPQWRKGGASAANPMLISAYGTGAEPLILTGTSTGFSLTGGSPVSHLVLQDISFDANLRDPTRGTVTAANAAISPTGVDDIIGGTDITVEGCSFNYFGCGLFFESLSNQVGDVTVRRDNVSNSYTTVNGHAQGLYAGDVDGLTVDQSVFDHNGWNATVAGAGMQGYNHGLYLYYDNTNVVVTNNVISNSSFAGIMDRCGGVIDGNLLLNNSAGIVFGTATGAPSTPGGVTGEIKNNVIMGDHSLPTTPFGLGIEVGNTKPGANVTVSGNLIAGDTQNSAQAAIQLDYASGSSNAAEAVGLNNVTVSNNVIHGWSIGIMTGGNIVDGGSGLKSLNGLTVTGNQVLSTGYAAWHQSAISKSAESWSNNAYASTTSAAKPFVLGSSVMALAAWQAGAESSAKVGLPTYTDATRTAATYAASLGKGSSADGLVAAAKGQLDSGASWNSAYTATAAVSYTKAGFTVKGTSVPPTTPAPTPTPTPTSTPSSTPTPTKLTGTTIGTTGSYGNDGNTAAKAFDGSATTYFDAPAANGGWAGLDLGSAKTVGSIKFAPRAGFASRMVGGAFQASTTPTFTAATTTTLYTVKAAPAAGLTTVTLATPISARYVRYVGPNGSYADVAEVQFYGSTMVGTPAGNVATGYAQFTGTAIGTAGSYQGQGNTIAKVIDGSVSTFFDAPTANGGWVGLDLGSSKAVHQIKFAPRAGYAARMVGGSFQVSNSATFSTGVTTVYTVTATPATGSLTTVTLSTAVAGRYVRYVGPTGSYGNIAEMQVFG